MKCNVGKTVVGINWVVLLFIYQLQYFPPLRVFIKVLATIAYFVRLPEIYAISYFFYSSVHSCSTNDNPFGCKDY